jgi:hypothetical protein
MADMTPIETLVAAARAVIDTHGDIHDELEAALKVYDADAKAQDSPRNALIVEAHVSDFARAVLGYVRDVERELQERIATLEIQVHEGVKP